MSKALKESKPSFPPTEEQEMIYEFVRKQTGNFLINALAGGGKTSTLEGTTAIIRPPWLYLAFNTAVVKEAKDRMPPGGKISTFNSMGLSCWPYQPKTNPNKMFELLNTYITDNIRGEEDRGRVFDSMGEILGAVGMAKNLGYIPEGKYHAARRLCTWEDVNNRIERPLDEFETEIVNDILFLSIQAAYAGAVDFNDQVYMPALFGGTFPRFPTVLVDENQDLSPVNHALLDKLVKGRIGSVGDRWQSIYGFRGAETHGVDKTKAKFKMTELALSYSFRCPENIVKAVHWHVPNMRWFKTGGRFEVLAELSAQDIPDGAAIICRNNAPLIRAAFGLLSNKRSVTLSGIDIGKTIIKLMNKIGSPMDTQDDLYAKINAWLDKQLQRANIPASLYDKAECMRIFASWGKNLYQATKYAEHIFSQQKGTITLSTGHKAKGLEWDVCYHLDPHLIRKEDEQDRNLKYVITTRAKQEMYEINTEGLQW